MDMAHAALNKNNYLDITRNNTKNVSLEQTWFFVQVCTLFFSCFKNITAEHNFEVLPVNKQQQKSDVRGSYSMFVQPWHSKVKTSIEGEICVGNAKPGYRLKRVTDFATEVLFVYSSCSLNLN